MFSLTIITGLASLAGCICMAFVCAAQMAELFTALRPAAPPPWEASYQIQPAWAEARTPLFGVAA